MVSCIARLVPSPIRWCTALTDPSPSSRATGDRPDGVICALQIRREAFSKSSVSMSIISNARRIDGDAALIAIRSPEK